MSGLASMNFFVFDSGSFTCRISHIISISFSLTIELLPFASKIVLDCKESNPIREKVVIISARQFDFRSVGLGEMSCGVILSAKNFRI